MALWAGSALAASEKVQETVRSAEALEWKGDAAGARALLEQAAHGSTDNADAILAYADFLAVHHDPAARHEYARALSAFAPERREDRQNAARRLVLLDLVDGDRDAARRDLEAYRAAGGDHWAAGVPADAPAGPAETIELPGPLRSFARMAALAPDVAPADLLPALARNVVTNGYRAAGGDVLEPTEYLKLTTRYLAQARELAHLAGDRAKILVPACDSAEAGDLLRILGYRMRGACGGDVVLETVNAGRAFLTIDSGFPVADLEQALRTNRKFEYPYSPTRVPILYGAAYWLSPVEKDSQFIDALLGDPMLCRIYLGLSKLDPETADALRQAAPFERLKAFAHVLDFYGGMFEVRGGKAVTPGGARAEAAWADLVGVPPAQGGAFFAKIVSKDDGWMASYFDALARIEGPVQEYLTEPQRMKRFYTAIRGRVTSPGPARPVFRANTDMMLLTTRLRLDPDGLPHIPGGLEVWKGLFAGRAFAKLDPRLSRAAPNWKAPDDLLEAMFGLCRKSFDNAPIAVFMNLSDLDRRRARPLDPATAQRLATDYAAYGSQYTLFSEEPSVSDRTILQYLDTARALTHIGDVRLRVDLAATFQALAGLWQIFCRQGFIPPDAADATLAGIVTPFTEARTERDLFDAGRAGVNLLLKAAGGSASAAPQDSILNLLAGAGNTSDSETQARVVQDMVRILEAQKLVSLDALFGLADNLDAVARGEKLDTALVGRVSARVAEIQVPWAALTSQEKGAMAVGDAVERHIEMEHRLNLKAVIERAQGGADRLRDVRGSLAPLLRDTLVGLNYVYYAPPGAEVLLTNPVFVRGHDFAGTPMQPLLWQATWPASAGWPSNAGGRLNGSLCGLPYALAAAEQDFMIPVREQALIWDDLAPQIIQSATIPRWWSVTPAELHWVALHLRYGESLVAESVLDAALRRQISGLLERQVPPARARKVDELIERGDVRAALDNIAPSELFMLARRMAPSGRGAGALADEIARMQRETPARIGYEEVSRDFGTPKPTLTGSYRPELLYLRTFPALMGYSSRILAESWESTLLYWAALADEVHAPPSQLNVLIPEWTERTIEQIFATHLEDWPALLRSLRNVGEDVRAKARARMETEQKASLD
jgi:hypothetical protein